ncbi:MAG: YraN family protein [Tenacibaculum sp.]
MALHNEFGRKAELLAVEFLIKKGYDILGKNYKYNKAEIDIIAQKSNTLIVVEVKARSSDYFGNPQDFVSAKKIKLLRLVTNEYMEEKELNLEVRFDIIAVLFKNKKYLITHIKDAFLHF